MTDAPLAIMTVFGTRPEAVKMAPVVQALRARPGEFRPITVVTAQHREMLDQVLRLFHIVPDHDLNVMQPEQSLAEITVRALEVPPWLRVDVLPGGLTTNAQTLKLSGIAPASALGTTVTLNITVSDTFGSAVLTLAFDVRPNVAPTLVRALPNYTTTPGSSYQWSIDVPGLFTDANGDALVVAVTVSPRAQGWIRSTVDSSNTVLLSAVPPDATPSSNVQDSDEWIRVTVTDPFGNSTSGTINVYNRLTTWQRVQTLVLALGGTLIVPRFIYCHVCCRFVVLQRVESRAYVRALVCVLPAAISQMLCCKPLCEFFVFMFPQERETSPFLQVLVLFPLA
jgi:hypothetical protein